MRPSVLLSALWGFSVTSAFSIRGSPEQRPQVCDCSGAKIQDGGKNSSTFICRDGRLGPKILPRKLPLGTLVSSYDRFGGLTPEQFLEKWTGSDGKFVYPPQNGFQLDTNGKPISSIMIIPKGSLVDRFGSEYGCFISAALAPYSQRALPPSNLDTSPDAPDFPNNYHVYLVLKDLTVTGGPIAPWFGQPGYGTQFFTGDPNIMQLIDQGFLERQDASVLVKKRKGCGVN